MPLGLRFLNALAALALGVLILFGSAWLMQAAWLEMLGLSARQLRFLYAGSALVLAITGILGLLRRLRNPNSGN